MNREPRHSRTVTVAEYNALYHIARRASILARQVRSYSTALGSNHLSRTTSHEELLEQARFTEDAVAELNKLEANS